MLTEWQRATNPRGEPTGEPWQAARVATKPSTERKVVADHRREPQASGGRRWGPSAK
jgi:hypothetical protein